MLRFICIVPFGEVMETFHFWFVTMEVLTYSIVAAVFIVHGDKIIALL